MQDDWEGGKISNAQLESVAYAMQRFKADPLPDGSKPGFFLGDGAGAKAVTVQAVWHRSPQVLALFCSATQLGKIIGTVTNASELLAGHSTHVQARGRHRHVRVAE